MARNICPECVQGKHANCDGTAWHEERDDVVACDCATAEHEEPKVGQIPAPSAASTPEFDHLTDEQATGVKRLRAMLPALSSYYDPRDDEARDMCLVCQDSECGGACQGAMEVVRQIIEALGCGDDDWAWWRESFADDGVTIPPGSKAPQ